MKRQLWSQTGKVIILLLSMLAYGYIGHRLLNFKHWDELSQSVQPDTSTLYLVSLIVILWFLNLAFETKKWQTLMATFIRLPFTKAWQQVMAGTTTAVGSPSRIAEMGGRMALLPKELRINAAVMTTVSGILQNFVIFTVGIASFALSGKNEPINLPYNYTLISVALVILTTATIIITYYFSDKIRYYLHFLKKLNTLTVVKAGGWTLSRYLVYLVQLYVWMQLFGTHLDIEEYIGLSTLYFFMITLIPSHVLIDMGIRGSVAMFLFSSAKVDTPLILASTFCLWLSNVMLPTLIGSIILIRQKVLKQRVIKKEA